MQTAIAWQESADRSTIAEGILGVDGGETFVTADKVQIPVDLPLIAAIIFRSESDTYYPIKATLTSPSMGGAGVGKLRLTMGYGASHKPSNVYDFRTSPLAFEGLGGELVESLAVEEDEAGVAHYIEIILIMSNGALPFKPHRVTHMPRATLAATGAAGWDLNNVITLEDDLPAGRYLLWGADLVSATASICRLKIPGYSRKPAFIPRNTELDGMHELNECVLPKPMAFAYQGSNFPVKVDILSEAAETPDHMTLFLEYLGGLSSKR